MAISKILIERSVSFHGHIRLPANNKIDPYFRIYYARLLELENSIVSESSGKMDNCQGKFPRKISSHAIFNY